MEKNKELKDRLKEARAQLGLSQTDLAHAAKTSQQAINKIETGDTKWPKNIKELALALGKRPEYLLFGEIIGDTLKLPITTIQNTDKAVQDAKSLPSLDISFNSRCFCLSVEDDSMVNEIDPHPTFPPGTIIVVDPTKEASVDKCVIARHKKTGRILFRRYTDMGLGYVLSALNVLGMRYPSCAVEDAEILGVVVASMNLDL